MLQYVDEEKYARVSLSSRVAKRLAPRRAVTSFRLPTVWAPPPPSRFAARTHATRDARSFAAAARGRDEPPLAVRGEGGVRIRPIPRRDPSADAPTAAATATPVRDARVQRAYPRAASAASAKNSASRRETPPETETAVPETSAVVRSPLAPKAPKAKSVATAPATGAAGTASGGASNAGSARAASQANVCASTANGSRPFEASRRP